MSDRFVSETDLEEVRRKRQEEWERVRKATDPLEAPEEEVDNRSLYERLKEVRDKKQADYEEEHRFKNMIRGLDTDESDFLSKVDDLKAQQDKLKREEEKAILDEFERARCHRITEDEEHHRSIIANLRPEPSTTSGQPKQSKQAAIIRSAIKRKSSSSADNSSSTTANTSPEGKRMASETENRQNSVEKTTTEVKNTGNSNINSNSNNNSNNNNTHPSAMKIIGVLPGMAQYASSSDDGSSSSSASDSDSSGADMPTLPILIRNVSSKDSDKSKHGADSSDD